MAEQMTATELADWLESPAGPEVGPNDRAADEQLIHAIAETLREIGNHEGCNGYDCGDCIGAILRSMRAAQSHTSGRKC